MKFQICCKKCSRQIPCPDNKEGCLVYHCKCDNPNCECHQEEILCSRCNPNTLDKCEKVEPDCLHTGKGYRPYCHKVTPEYPIPNNKIKPEGVGERWEEVYDKQIQERILNEDNPQYVLGWNACRYLSKQFIKDFLMEKRLGSEGKISPNPHR